MMSNTPLPERMRPRNLDEYVGQEHLIGEGAVLRKNLESGVIPSIIFWGPPGVGKTTLAQIISQTLKRPFHTLSAINSGVKDVREVIEKAKKQQFFNSHSPILFIDEIHRFSKSQQDSLLGAVEKGVVTLIGATTENPSFEVIPALLSRSQVYVLQALEKSHLELLLNRALTEDEILKEMDIELVESDALFLYSGGDARKLLNTLEIVIHHLSTQDEKKFRITNEVVKTSLQQNMMLYDKNGEQHYDIISAFIKSIRGSDPSAAVYWLARMVEGGEAPEFIARRLLISASEDIGLANPTALVMANTCFDAVKKIGYPECDMILSQTTIYLATSPKSNTAYTAIRSARQTVKQSGNLPVPLSLRNAPTKLMKQLDYGKGYHYSHDYPGNFAYQEFLPDELSNELFYSPGNNKREQQVRDNMKQLWRDKYPY